jgi:hypothetical protein
MLTVQELAAKKKQLEHEISLLEQAIDELRSKIKIVFFQGALKSQYNSWSCVTDVLEDLNNTLLADVASNDKMHIEVTYNGFESETMYTIYFDSFLHAFFFMEEYLGYSHVMATLANGIKFSIVITPTTILNMYDEILLANFDKFELLLGNLEPDNLELVKTMLIGLHSEASQQ